MRCRWVTGNVVALALGLLWAGSAVAREKSVAEEILDILQTNGQISEEQYRDLLNKARAEEEARQAAVKTKQEEPGTFRFYWKEGMRLDSADKKFKLKLGGRIMNDWALFDEDDDIEAAFGELGSGTEFRRAKFYMEGTVYDVVDFKAEYDLAGGDADFKDVWVGLKKLPLVGNLKVGHLKEPFSLEELTDSKYITFMERSLADMFVPERNTGIMFHDHALQERLTWAAGAFRETDDFGQGFGEDSEYNVTARLTALPWYMDKGRQLLHLGFSYSHKFRNNDPVRFRQQPEAHLSPVRFVDTKGFASDGADLVNPEAALVFGPFSLQGEYFHAFVDAPDAGDPEFNGYYVMGSYFLTGEHRRYEAKSGVFSRVKPRHNFDGKGGLGAWEVGLRYSHLDLDDAGIRGGELDDLTVGLNWYLNPNTRVMLNYVFADLDDVGDTNIFQTRFQIDF